MTFPRSARFLLVALLLAGAVSAQARAPRDDLFDPSTLDSASCDSVIYGSDNADVMAAQSGQSLTGLGGNDDLTGADGTFCLTGGDGNDTLTAQTTGREGPWLDGGPGNDRLVGGPLADLLKAGPGNDVISGGAGNDVIDGGAGNDVIDGGAGNDRITGGSGHNRINGGPGDDLISANDGSRERIDCGPGDDIVHADRGDRLIGCEHVKYHANPYPQIAPRSGGLSTRFFVHWIAPYTTEIPANDEGNAGYQLQAVTTPSPGCEVFVQDASPTDVLAGTNIRARFTITPRRARCRGTYKVAVTVDNTSFGVECNSQAGAKPRNQSANLSDCPFTDTVGYFTFRIKR